ncbi:hypothetical protein HRI_000190900 [Hibiscus trionum]|uniref:Uncharacterized protein n=1 Tax=Hibiscus trionum TaxID=183268 RepID=A0A9W7GW92_HIBTR|nr:hypothetical protein HRI_000190900 [Hibiscus trionum]
MSTIGLETSDCLSTPILEEFEVNLDDANKMNEDEIDLENAEVHVPQTNATNNSEEWDIKNKVFTISVDNASANDSCIQIIKDTFSLTKKLICGGDWCRSLYGLKRKNKKIDEDQSKEIILPIL